MQNKYLKANSEEAATTTEYVILVVFIALLVIAGATFFSGRLNEALSDTGTYIKSQEDSVTKTN